MAVPTTPHQNYPEIRVSLNKALLKPLFLVGLVLMRVVGRAMIQVSVFQQLANNPHAEMVVLGGSGCLVSG